MLSAVSRFCNSTLGNCISRHLSRFPFMLAVNVRSVHPMQGVITIDFRAPGVQNSFSDCYVFPLSQVAHSLRRTYKCVSSEQDIGRQDWKVLKRQSQDGRLRNNGPSEWVVRTQRSSSMATQGLLVCPIARITQP